MQHRRAALNLSGWRGSKEPFVKSARVFVAVAAEPEAVSVESLETVPDGSRLVSCPLCHTTHPSLTYGALESGGDWRCHRCGQRWDAKRLATVAGYAAWAAAYDSRTDAADVQGGESPC